jgi:O-antigen ligase
MTGSVSLVAPANRAEPKAVAAALGLAAALGSLAAVQPKLGIGMGLVLVLIALALTRPVAFLVVLIVVTAIVPLSIQNQFSLGGGLKSPGVSPADVLLLIGLGRTALVLPHSRLRRRQLLAVGMAACLLPILAFQAYRGIGLGRSVGDVAAEFRVLLGFAATVLIAVPIVGAAESRERLFRGLVVVGLALGLWGLAQWSLHLSFAADSDFGVRSGVRLTSGGIGQIQGGLFAFGPACMIAIAVLTSGRLRARKARLAVWAVLALNAMNLVLTFERSFWLGAILGCTFILVKAYADQRIRLLLSAPLLATAAFLALSTLSPGTLTTAQERFMSLGRYQTDDSVIFRRVESAVVLTQIRAHPVLGSGLAATTFMGPGTLDLPWGARRFAHNGYLWLWWKVGLVGAGLVWALLLLAVTRRRPPPEDRTLFPALLVGAQAALVLLMLSTVAFPSFNILSITPAMGLLVALCVAPGGSERRHAGPRRRRLHPVSTAARPVRAVA